MLFSWPAWLKMFSNNVGNGLQEERALESDSSPTETQAGPSFNEDEGEFSTSHEQEAGPPSPRVTPLPPEEDLVSHKSIKARMGGLT